MTAAVLLRGGSGMEAGGEGCPGFSLRWQSLATLPVRAAVLCGRADTQLAARMRNAARPAPRKPFTGAPSAECCSPHPAAHPRLTLHGCFLKAVSYDATFHLS
eukprot:363545-Chlamydomonas_euryale.AAC.1